MEHTAEDYGAYWSGAVRIAAGALLVWFGSAVTAPFLASGVAGAMAIGLFLVAGLTLLGTYAAVLGLAIVVRTAVAAERRR